MRNQLRADDVADKGGKVWCDRVHSLFEVVLKRVPKLNELVAPFRKSFQLKLVGLCQFLSHRYLRGIDDLLGFFIIKNNIADTFFHFVSNIFTCFNKMNKFSENGIIIDDFAHFRKMPGEPLLQPHTKCVDVFVKLLNKSNSLDDGFILPIYVCCTLGS